MSAHAHALVASCMDLRFQKTIHEWLTKNNLYDLGHDRISFAGAGGNFEYLMSQVRLSIKLHSPPKIQILNHQNCGYYGDLIVSGSPEELQKHTEDLKNAKIAINKEFPDVLVKGYFLTLDNQVKELDL